MKLITASSDFRGLCHKFVNIDAAWLRCCSLHLVLQLLNLAQPLVLQQIFDKVIGQQNLDTLYTLVLFSWLLVCSKVCLVLLEHIFLLIQQTGLIFLLGAEVIQHLLRLPQGYFDKRPVGELQTRLAELGNIRGFLTGSLLTLHS